jgi:hypothetical protein
MPGIAGKRGKQAERDDGRSPAGTLRVLPAYSRVQARSSGNRVNPVFSFGGENPSTITITITSTSTILRQASCAARGAVMQSSKPTRLCNRARARNRNRNRNRNRSRPFAAATNQSHLGILSANSARYRAAFWGIPSPSYTVIKSVRAAFRKLAPVVVCFLTMS